MKTLRTLGGVAALSALALSGCPTSCFVAGTRILTPKGPKNIEDLAVGDRVLAWDTLAGAPVERTVAAVVQDFATETFAVRAGDSSIAGVTGHHPFWDADRKVWLAAGHLTPTTSLWGWQLDLSGRKVPIAALERRHHARVPVYNLTVAGPEQNYFAEGLLVHNKSIVETCDSASDCYNEGLICVVQEGEEFGYCDLCSDDAECEDQYGPGSVCFESYCAQPGDAGMDAADDSGTDATSDTDPGDVSDGSGGEADGSG